MGESLFSFDCWASKAPLNGGVGVGWERHGVSVASE
jgi:hypothetical protein